MADSENNFDHCFVQNDFPLKTEWEEPKRFVVLVTDGFMLPDLNLVNLDDESFWLRISSLRIGQISSRYRQQGIRLIISGDTDTVMKNNWIIYDRIAQSTGKRKS